MGENGAGKSTLMNILGGVLPADAARSSSTAPPSTSAPLGLPQRGSRLYPPGAQPDQRSGHLREHVHRPGTENQIRPVGRQNYDSKDPGGL
ncbi:hypothetical protein M5E87_04975 [Flavonifractor plautii]|nr:hypothetical protein M5E87_04975 [Flavonifractor plautii]